MENDELTKVIVHYQQGIEKYSQRNDEAKILHCISKLHRLPIKVQNLEQTGVGRTVNSLRKINGKIGDSAKLLVGKWKEMVMEESDEQNSSKAECESKDDHKSHSSGSDYKESDKRSKFVESNSYSSSSEKNEHENEKKSKSKNGYDKESTSSKRKSNHDSDEDTDQRIGKYHHRHKLSKKSHEDNLDDDDDDDDNSRIQNNKNESKHSSSKGKKDDAGRKSQKTMELKKLSDDNLDQQLKKRRNEEKEERHSSKHKKEKKDCKSRKHESSHKSSRKSIENTKSSTETKEKHSKRYESKKIKSESLTDSSFNNVGETIGENGIGSGSGTSFAEALGMLMPGTSKNKRKVAVVQPLLTKKEILDNDFSEQELGLLTESKLEPLNINVSHLLPDITPNYRPLGNSINGQSRCKILNDDETLVQIMNTKISRTKVFSGNKCTFGNVPSLFDMCTRILQDNIDSLEYTGGVPFDILKSVIERATSDQLFTLEHHNPYLIEDTDELWKFHCQKEFRNKHREEMETWRDMYLRCLDEREAKLKALTANIKLSQDKSLPVRQTKLAYVDGIVKPDRSILRKQAKFGTGIKDSKPLVTPSARLAKIVSNSTSGQVVVPNLSQRNTSTSSSNLKPKKAPLMQKTLSFMKNRHFRR